jgi:hypothetical protein
MLRILAIAATLACVVSADATAQIVQRPARPYRGLFGGGPTPDPNRSRTELTFAASALMGYDTWLSPGGSTIPDDPTLPRQSGGAFTGDAALSYFRGRARRSVTVDGRMRSNAYSGINADATLGGTAVIAAVTDLGSVMRLRASQHVGYEPTLVLSADPSIAVVDPDAPAVPVAEVTSGYLNQRSWSLNSLVSLDRRWSPRHITEVGVEYSGHTYLDDLGYDTTNRAAHAMHDWSFSRTASLHAQYTFDDSDFESLNGQSTPMRNQDVQLTLVYNRRLSPSRRLRIEGGGGAIYVETLRSVDRSALTYWMPSGQGAISWDLGRTWSIGGDYNRSANVLEGVSLTSFATDSASAAVSGLFGSRIEATAFANYSNGRSGGADTTGRFENYSGSVQILYAFSRCCATTVNYDYYVYHFQNVADLPTGVPTDFDRHAIRVGFTLWLPLYGRYVGGESSRGIRRN